MVSIRFATATAVLLAIAGCTASAVVADSIAAKEAPPAPLTGCRESNYTEGICTYKVTKCSFYATVCVTTPPPSSCHACEMGGSVPEAMEHIKEHNIECFP